MKGCDQAKEKIKPLVVRTSIAERMQWSVRSTLSDLRLIFQ